jgi:hypothetical protein
MTEPNLIAQAFLRKLTDINLVKFFSVFIAERF